MTTEDDILPETEREQ